MLWVLFIFVDVKENKMKRIGIFLLMCMLCTFTAYAYEYVEYFDTATGTRTFYLQFDKDETYHPLSERFKPKKDEVILADAPTEAETIAETVAETEPETEPETEAETEPETIPEPEPVYSAIKLSEEDAEALRWVLCLEEEGFEEECRVCETIFNRVLSEKNWGNTVGEVLAKKGQFSTYKYIGSSKAWRTPGELEDDVISEVLRETSIRLPSMRYVYFDSKGGVNGKDHVRYGGTTK